jgi:hypothetical protein
MKLNPGDLIFYPVTPKSRFIPRFISAIQILRGEGISKTSYSHVSIIDSDMDYELEQYVPKSRRHLIDWSRDIEIWRVKNVDQESVAIALRWCRSSLGQWYDIGRAFFGIFKTAHANICSTFVARDYQEANIDLTKNAGRFIGPNELISSGLLENIKP